MNSRLSLKFATLLTAGALATSLSHATLLSPNSSIGLSLEAEPVGASLVTSMTNQFTGLNSSAATVFTGNLVSSVWSGDTSNPWGGLTFSYLLSNDADSQDAIGELNLSSFATFLTDVSYDGPGIVPWIAARGGLPTPDVKITFYLLTQNFQDNLLPGQNTALLVIQTDAFAYGLGNASIINAGTASTDTLVPVVPEPSTLALAALGLMALAASRKTRA